MTQPDQNSPQTPPVDMAAFWNGPAGQAWSDLQADLDAMFAPFEAALAEVIPPGSDAHVLDIGCGAGATSLAIARRLGPGGVCVGLDVSEPLITLARARAEREGSRARFVCADVESHPFEPHSGDHVVSRFGVMFFADPVAAFARLRAGARQGGALTAFAWRAPRENPFMTTGPRALAPHFPEVAAQIAAVPSGYQPGQFAFADRAWVIQMLTQAGWTDPKLDAFDVDCALSREGLKRFSTRLGPLGQIMAGLDADRRRKVWDTVEPAFAPFIDGETVRFTAACWRLTARA